MYRMDKITTGVSYGFAGANGGFWVLQLLAVVMTRTYEIKLLTLYK